MAIISTFADCHGASCTVTLPEDEGPVMAHVSIGKAGPLKLTIDEAFAVCDALDEALGLFLDEVYDDYEDEETIH